ncbi:tail tubular protein A [Pseudomonas phage Eisa9]|uniref:Tail tubular protein A n=1 Tax=Pseudomonas phage Eisa9 TaxID=2900148 RepID=A0AAE8YKH4_9CAUD|nr:tail tubular protein A [Pseudomonas phage Eisa9]
MMLTELEVVNECLASMGELPINSIANSTNPMVTNARAAFQRANVGEQGVGWWFNTETVKITPQTDGTCFVPADTLSLYTKDKYNPQWLTIRGRKLYDTGNAEYYTTGNPISIKLIRYLPFNDLPYNAQRLVAAATVEKFQLNYDGDQQKQTAASDEYTASYALCMMDHTRAVGANMLNDGGTGRARASTRIPFPTGRRFR